MRRLLLLASLTLSLPAFAAITGTVMTRDGSPIAGAKVSTFELETPDARRARWLSASQRKPLLTGTTDSKGSFSLESPKDGVIDVSVDAAGYAPEVFRIERDQEVGAIILSPAAAKQGSVTANGKPVEGAAVYIAGGSDEILVKTDANGRFSVPDPSQWAARIAVIHPDYAVQEEFATTGPMATPKIDLHRKVDAGVAISGKVLARTGESGVAGALVSVDGWPLAKSGEDGTFSIAHAPKKWANVEVRSADMTATRASTATGPFNLRLVPAATVYGTLRDVRTQAPIPFAEVRLGGSMFSGRPSGLVPAVLSDAKGNYSISPVPPGNYSITVIRPGYSVGQTTAAVTAGQKLQKALIGTPESRVTGVVLDEEKKPIAAARITTTQGQDGGPFVFRGPAQTRQTYSGPDGRYSVATTSEGDVSVLANKRGWPSGRSTAVALKAGDRRTNVVVTIPRGIEVTGVVTDKDKNPLSGVAVSTSEAASGGMGGMMMRRFTMQMGGRPGQDDSVRTNSDGTFSIRVKEGNWDFGFKREGYAMKGVRAVKVAANAPPERMEVVLEPGVEIAGKVVRNGNGVDAVNVSAFSPENQAFVTTGPDGSFVLTDLAPGSVMLNVTKNDEFIQMNRNVTAPTKDVLIEVPAGGRITGRVVVKGSRQPLTQFQAGLERSRQGGGMVMMMPPQLRSFTSDDGSFVLENVPVGQTQVVASAAGYITGRVANIVVEEGKTVSGVEVALETGVKLTGKVTGPDGTPVPSVNVRASMDGPAPRMTAMAESAISDANGEYSIEGLEPGERTFVFVKSGFPNVTKTVELKGTETRLDAQFAAGLRISGTVTNEAGVPIPDANVNASSAAAGSGGRSTRTDSTGNFTFEGLSSGRYTFTANKEPYTTAYLRDYDISSGASPRLVLRSGGTVHGRVTGLSEKELTGAFVSVRGQAGAYADGPVDPSGAYRVEGAPAGPVTVVAETQRGFGERRSSEPRTAEVSAGSSTEVNIEFASSTTIRGRVTRDGKSVASANVNFFPKGRVGSSANTTTDSNGNYSLALQDGAYSVMVMEPNTFARFNTTYDVSGSATFDIDMRTASLRGRVVDASTGEAIYEARVQVRRSDPDGPNMNTTAITDAAGGFLLEGINPGNYTVIADKTGYGNITREVSISDTGSNPDIEIKLGKSDGVVIKLVDGRDQRQLSGDAIVYDAQNRPLNPPGMRWDASSPEGVKLALAPGQYRVVVWASGYAARNVIVTSPSKPTVALTPGGQLAFNVKTSSNQRRVRLIDSSGYWYGRFVDQQGTFSLIGSTTLQNVAPGAYKVQILGDGNVVTETYDVVISEGKLSTLEI